MTGWIRFTTLLAALLLAGCSHQAHTQQDYGSGHYSDAELDQMLAPIALYPDVILSQVLMAATFPGEIAEAAVWSYDHPELRGEAAVAAVADRGWDPSVQALVAFPDLVRRLADDGDWTWRLGDAYLAQEADVMDAIQRLRDHAYRGRHLESLDHLNVYRDNDIVIIEPANPRLVYLPYYRPQVVYGDWWWPSHPPHYWHSPAHSRLGFHWSDGFSLGAGFFFSGFHWHNHHIVTFDRRHYRAFADRRYYRHYPNPKPWYHHGRHPGIRHYRGDDHRYRDDGRRYRHDYRRPDYYDRYRHQARERLQPRGDRNHPYYRGYNDRLRQHRDIIRDGRVIHGNRGANVHSGRDHDRQQDGARDHHRARDGVSTGRGSPAPRDGFRGRDIQRTPGARHEGNYRERHPAAPRHEHQQRDGSPRIINQPERPQAGGVQPHRIQQPSPSATYRDNNRFRATPGPGRGGNAERRGDSREHRGAGRGEGRQ